MGNAIWLVACWSVVIVVISGAIAATSIIVESSSIFKSVAGSDDLVLDRDGAG